VKRPKHIFWKKLVRTFRLKGLYSEWQRQIIDTGIKRWATLEELSEPKENEIYRVKVLGKRNKHANRPGKGRRAQRKIKNFQWNWRPPAEHNVNVGTVTNDLCLAERDQRLAKKPVMKMPDTRPRIMIERPNKNPISITREDEPPRPPEWIPLELRPDLIRLSEQGERKLADSRMDDWVKDQVEYEKRQQDEIEQRKIALEKEKEFRVPNDQGEERRRETARKEELRLLKERKEERQQELARERESRLLREQEEKRRQEITSAELAHQYSPETLRQRVQEEEDRIAHLSETEQQEEKRAFRKCLWDVAMNQPEDYVMMLRWRAYRNQEERRRKEQR
jgi:hypothetical protein